MQNKFLLTFTLFVAYASIALAATGDSCTNAQTITVDLNSTPRIDFSVTPFTPPANSLNAVSGFTQDPCKYPGSADPDQSANKVYWFKWAPSADTLASMELTNANRSYYYTERVLIISTNGVAPCTNNVNWNCEGQILNECQGYTSTVGGNSVQPAAYNFRQGRTYYFLVNTVNDTAAQLFFALVHKIQIYGQNFESIATGNLPSGWSRNSSSLYGGWNVSSVPQANSLNINFSQVDPNPVGGVGSKILYLNPQKNLPLTEAQCQNTTNFKYCNHTFDSITTDAFSLATYSSAQLLFSTYFYNGATGINTNGQIYGQILASIDSGATYTLVHDMISLSSGNPSSPFWYTESIDLSAYGTEASVMIKFVFGTMNGYTFPQLGWLIDNIQVIPATTYDMCDDGYACTNHICLTTGTGLKGCQAVANDSYCSAGSVSCIENVCLPSNSTADADGCVASPIPNFCDDGRSCTEDTCSQTGANATTGCTNAERNSLCDDHRGCTVNYCTNLDNEYADLAGADGCAFIQQCDDLVDCTDDSCENSTTGEDKCLHTINFQRCDDNIDCTYELTCDPEQAGYDKVTGCIRIPMHEWCDDNDPCTIDTCEASLNMTNSCVNTNVTCDDCLACTTDYCVDGACEHEPDNDACTDHFDCTVDICDESLGKCTNTPNDTYCEYFGDLCSHHYCRPWASTDGSGCVSVAKVCDDQIHCSENYCDELTGDCIFVANDTKCIDESSCTDDSCDLDLGKCVNKPNSANCDDQDSCTVDFCSMNGTCDAFAIDCQDEVLCSDDWCEGGSCQHYFNNSRCDDGFDCTSDVCDESLGKCTNNPSDLYCTERGNPCYIHYCNVESSPDATGCYSVPKDCSDAITCTYDYCDELTGECHHVANDSFCDDGHECTDDVCDIGLGRCTNFANNVNCEDGDVCTEKDICGDDGECHYVPLYCNDQIYCTVDFCDSNTVEGCQFVANDSLCDDGNDCTDDYCSVELGRCVNIPMNSWCPGRSSCESGVCSLEAAGCVYESHDNWCDDLVGCTLDVCNGPEGCDHVARNSLCDDGIGCTDNVCNGTGCQYIVHNEWCADGIECTDDICSTTEDCLNPVIENFCNDNINCTMDTCSPTEDCQYTPVNSWCSDGVGCTVDTCVPDDAEGNFCHNTAEASLCEDGFSCSSHVCDLDAGCQTNYTSCPWYDRTLDDKNCINCMSASGQIVQTHYEDGTGAMGFVTLNGDSNTLEQQMTLTPGGSVVIGGDQNQIPIAKSDGLVVGTNMRIVPHDVDFEVPACNEIRRGSFVVVQEQFACGDEVCHQDVVKICVKDAEYHYVTLNTQPQTN